ncbi:DUF4148 domain-containing protein [Burkholderia plantarii]|uniref:DUF4148 domain-containing protein n=1 Tax=Burkholderia plantarii TaxID=41899 RepID=UPI0018DC8D72|nr:DUF4148 domain-containing protein [Burkholderia plantarii]MBI0327098.1 DUF4148 domain-containing protein [Burkholderia plantarii]
MKIIKLAAAAMLAATALPALAQAAVPAGTPGAQPMAAAATTNATSAQPGQWVAPYGQPVHEKTRAEVYQELVQAEQDGQLKYLNSTLYAH